MNVQDLFARLSYGELSSLSISEEGSGAIATGKEDQVLSAISLALTSIYTRFQHRISYLVLEAMEGVPSYVLDLVHCESHTEAPHTTPRYIKDVTEMPAPFPDDLIRILAVTPLISEAPTQESASAFVPINARRTPFINARITAFNELRLGAAPGDLFEVEYQAKHPALSLASTIQIMPALEEALQARAAAAIFSGMAGEAHVARSAELMARYEQLCSEAKINDMAQETNSDEFDRLRDKGFV